MICLRSGRSVGAGTCVAGVLPFIILKDAIKETDLCALHANWVAWVLMPGYWMAGITEAIKPVYGSAVLPDRLKR